ncbi:hypothetical protein COT48_04500 [Candidatus Woesearchaeota archaeon CG08_land_8_20_14_0_20_47_9]|nr:MAG: hypothetical protein COT48_04500 [Candidatus Woesearchaeota archaeon CG08_land_8_20_14_0_20_47_9]
MITDYLIMAARNITKKRLRSWLTMMGIFVGIAAVVALISIGQGFQRTINEEFEKVGTNRITVQPGSAFGGTPGSSMLSAKLYDRDVRIVRRVSGVEYALGMFITNAKLEFKDEVKYGMVMCTPTDAESLKAIRSISFLDIETGRELRGGDNYVAVAGYRFGTDYFDKPVKAGDKLYINGKRFEVVGVQKKAGTGVHDLIIRIPMHLCDGMFNRSEEVSMISILVRQGLDPPGVADAISEELRQDHGRKKGEEDFTVQTAQQILNSFNAIIGVVQAVLVGIAAISLLVGGIGIMNTMYTAVLERTKEIGIMKAVGARNSDIMKLFLFESGLLGITGGIIGVVLGFGISKAIEFAITMALGDSLLRAYFPWQLIMGALAFAFVVGAASGTLPALQAASLKPVDALRYE